MHHQPPTWSQLFTLPTSISQSERMLMKQARHMTRVDLSYKAIYRTASRSTYSAFKAPFTSFTRPCAKPRAQRLATPWHQYRVAVRKTALSLDQIPQGVIGSALPPQDDAEPEYPPLLQQVRNNMLKFSHCVVLTRVGGFYEVSAPRRPSISLTQLAIL